MQLDSHKVPFFNKTADLKAVLNQLGLRNASEVLYTSLLPGLNNVSNRIRYYSFYCWLIGEFYKNRESFAENGGYPPKTGISVHFWYRSIGVVPVPKYRYSRCQ